MEIIGAIVASILIGFFGSTNFMVHIREGHAKHRYHNQITCQQIEADGKMKPSEVSMCEGPEYGVPFSFWESYADPRLEMTRDIESKRQKYLGKLRKVEDERVRLIHERLDDRVVDRDFGGFKLFPGTRELVP